MQKTALCPCHSKKNYAECCLPYHEGKQPPTPLALMRSRYSAYALGLVDYIVKTTHPQNPEAAKPLLQRRKEIEEFCQQTRFVGLEILESTENTVTFNVILFQRGREFSFKEKSDFEKVAGQWLYLSGELSS